MTIVRPIVPPIVGPLRPALGSALPWDSAGGGAALSPPTVSIASDGAVIGVGETLTATVTGSPTPTVRWQRGATFGGGGSWANIGGATALTYVVVEADVGFSLRCLASNAVASDVASNTLLYLHATDLSTAAIGVSTSGVTQATGTVSAWATSLGGLTLTLTAPASTNEPAYDATGGVGSRPLITFDGNDNVLRLAAWTSGVTWDDYEIGIVGHRVATSVDGDLFISYATGGFNRFSLQDLDASTFKFVVASGATQVSTTDPDTTPRHFSGSSIGGSQVLRVNGAAEDTDAATTTSRADGGAVSVGATVSGTTASNIAIQAFYFSRALTAGKRTNLRALLTNATGIAC